MRRNKIESTAKPQSKNIKEKNDVKTKNILNINIESLPETVGFFYEHGLTYEDYYDMAEKLNYFVSEENPEYYNKLKFSEEMDNVQSFISKMIYPFLVNNESYCPMKLFKYYKEERKFKILTVIELDYTVFHLTADFINTIEEDKMKSLMSHFFIAFSKLCQEEFMSYTYENIDSTYARDIIEMELENLEYELDAEKENAEEMIQNPDEEYDQEIFNDELTGYALEIEQYKLEAEHHLQNCKAIKKTILESESKYDLEFLKNHDFGCKEKNDLRDSIYDLCYNEWYLHIQSIDYNTDMNGGEALFHNLFVSTYSHDDSFDKEHARSSEMVMNNEGHAFICTAKILEKDNIIDCNSEEVEWTFKNLFQDLYNIFEHLRNDSYK